MKTIPDSSTDAQSKWWRSPGMLYFLAAGIPPVAVQIGVTTRATMLKRLQKVQMHNHEPVQLLGVVRFADGEFPTRDAEDEGRLLHERFAHLARFKAHTRGAEWLTASPDLLELIEECTIPPEVAGLPRFVCTPLDGRSLQ